MALLYLICRSMSQSMNSATVTMCNIVATKHSDNAKNINTRETYVF